jgi:CRISPR-associated protein Cmr3
LDIAYDKDDKSGKKPFQLELSENSGLNSQTESNFQLTHQLQGKEGTATVNFKPGGLIKQTDFEDYLAGKANFESDESKIEIIDDYWQPEPKVGIGRDRITKTAKEGMLYRVGMMRFDTEKYEEVEIKITYSGLEELQASQFRLGGESKTVNCKIQGIGNEKIVTPEKLAEGGIFKLYLATPALFENGTFPSWTLEKGKRKKEIELEEGLTVELISMAIGKPQHIGGFDMKKGRPKPMLKAVPAGSIYYFKLTKGTFSKVVERFHGKSISEFPEQHFGKQGFGICYVGIQPPKSTI